MQAFGMKAVGRISILTLAAAALAADIATAQELTPVHAIAIHGEPKYGPDFTHFDYVNPDAPQGGDVTLHAIGNFDTFNPYVIKGVPAAGISLTFESLMTSSADEPFTEYGLIAESMEMPEDRSFIIYNLRAEARFHDGEPITADDVVFSLNVLKEKGQPFFRFYYGNVEAAEKLGERRVKFTFSGDENRELPMIIGQMPILPEHYWRDRDFEATTLDPPLGSGPYKVRAFEPGRFVEYERVADYWGDGLPVNRGQYNFGTIRYDYYRDATVATEAFKAGEYDFRAENIAKQWATAYDIPAVRDGRIVKREFGHGLPSGMQGFAFNLRRPIFADPQVRRALAYAFDFEWSNENLFFGQYIRTESYFDNSDLASRGLPEGEEREILERFRDRLPAEVFTEAYAPPTTQGGSLRDNLRTALGILRDAGWEVKDGVLTDVETGAPFAFEIMLNAATASSWERIVLPYAQNLKRLGIEATVRTVDPNQYQNRLDSYDFDMLVQVWGQSLSPGNEQREFWGSEAAERPGSRNVTGLKHEVVDALIELVISAPDRESLVHRVRALDRVLLWHHLVVPHWHIPYSRIVYWDKFGLPETVPMQGVQFLTWWVDKPS